MLFDPKKPANIYALEDNNFITVINTHKNYKYKLLVFNEQKNQNIFFHFPGLDQQNGAFVKKASSKGHKEVFIYQRLIENNFTIATVPYPQFMKNDSDHKKYFEFINKAIIFLKQKNPNSRIIFGGHSFGGNIFLYAVENQKIKLDKNDVVISLNSPLKRYHLIKKRYLYIGYRHMTAVRIKIQTILDRNIPTQSLRGYLKRSIWLKNYTIKNIEQLPKNIFLFAHQNDKYVRYSKEEFGYKNVFTWDEAGVDLNVDLPSCHNASYYFPEFINAIQNKIFD
jgi:hypothetical protein